MFGFYSQTEPIAYVHLIAVRNNYRKLGLGIKMYEHFINVPGKTLFKGKSYKKTSKPDSIVFHKSIGMELTVNGILMGYLLFSIAAGLERIGLFL